MEDLIKIAPPFIFQLPRKMLFGNGTIESVGEEAEKLFGAKKKVMIVTDVGIRKAGLLDKSKNALENSGFGVVVFDGVVPEPTFSVALEATKIARDEKVDIVFGIGGGSSIDSAKAISVLVPHDGEIFDIIGEHRVPKPGLPKIFVPTTAGTGAEISNTFVLTDDIRTQKKTSSQSEHTYADLTVVDPELTLNLPPRITAESGLDALSHALESFVGVRANPLSEMFSIRAIELIGKHLRRAFANGANDPDARYAMCMGTVMGTMAIRSSGVGAIHSTSYPVSKKYELSHGMAIALMMPAVMEYNLIANLPKYKAIARAIGECVEGLSLREAAERSVAAIKRLVEDLGIRLGIRHVGVTEDDFEGFAADVVTNYPRITPNNARALSKADVVQVYRLSY